MMDSSTDDRDPVEVLAEEYLELQRSGKSPTIAEFAARYPDRALEIRELFPAILAMERLKTHCEVPGGSRASLGASRPEQLGDFRLLNEIGRGGMGVVYEALHESLGRYVAVKVLPKQSIRQSRAFQREARTAARLHHTNIVPLFGVGEQDGYHYIVMQRIQGVDLEDVLSVLRTLCAAVQPKVLESKLEGHSRTSLGWQNAVQLARFLVADSTGPSAASAPDTVFGNAMRRVHLDRALVPETDPSIPVSEPGGSDPTSNDLRSRFTATSRGDEAIAFLSSTQLLGASYWRRVAVIGRQVADALQYAHQQRVLHHDIKPANLLLDSEGVVWITDFGLAKIMDDSHASHWGTLAGTLRYMAPEQFSGQSDHRSDVYSLGITLYELLTLQPAYQDSSRAKLIHRITNEVPRSPSNICPGIPSDLESIVLKAIARDPSQRYQSAGELACDLQRFLDDCPVTSRPLSSLQRLRQWTRRNRVVAILSSIAALLLMTTTVFGVAQFVQRSNALTMELQLRGKAETERMRAEASLSLAAEAFDAVFGRISGSPILGSLDAALEEIPPDLVSRGVVSERDAAVLRELLTFYDQFATANVDDLRWQRETARAFCKAGEIQLRLESYADAEADLRRALVLYELLSSKEPANVEHVAGVAGTRNQLANLAWNTGRRDNALEESQAAWQFLSRSPVLLNQSPACRLELARAYNRYAISYSASRSPPLPEIPSRPRTTDPREYLHRAIEIVDSLLVDTPRNIEYSLTLAESYRYLWGLECFRSRFTEARAARERSIVILEELLISFPAVPQCRVMLVDVCLLPYRLHGGEYVDKDSPRQADRAVEVASDLADRYPMVPRHQVALAQSWWATARALEKADRKDAAMVNLGKAIALQKSIGQQFPGRSRTRFEIIPFLEDQVRLTRAIGTRAELRSAIEELIATVESGPDSLKSFPPSLRTRSQAYSELATVLREEGDQQAAQAAEVKAKELSIDAARRATPSFRPGDSSPAGNGSSVAAQP